jgi:hypothetical protein
LYGKYHQADDQHDHHCLENPAYDKCKHGVFSYPKSLTLPFRKIIF